VHFQALFSRIAIPLLLLVSACMLLMYSPQIKAQEAIQECGSQPINMADQNWESASFITHVIRLILEEVYGCNVEVVPGATAATESALVQNDIQIIAEQWSGRSAIIESGIEEGKLKVVGDTLKGGAEQGWYVPKFVIEGDKEKDIEPMAPDLKTWKDLPDYKELFKDAENPEKGRFLNCPTGWVCEKTNSRLLEIYDLEDDYVNFRAGTGAALDSAISSAVEQGRPILFYYWQPAGLMAKYDFAKIEQEPFDEACWDTIVSGEGELCASDFLLARLGVAVSTPFAENYPQLVEFFEHLQFEPDDLNGAILVMNEARLSGDVVARDFLENNPQAWQEWVPKPVAQRLATAFNLQDAAVEGTSVDHGGIFPSWNTANWVNTYVTAIVQDYGSYFRQLSNRLLTTVLLPVEQGLMQLPPWLLLLITGALSWHATRRPIASLMYVVGLYLIGAVGLWDKLIQTFALVVVATLLSIVIGIPVGIVAARLRWLRQLLTPVLDVMQTLPSFVYLIPVLMLFGLGKVPALFATIIYAIPPLIRLTILGLRHVDHNITEAAQSFGVTRWQMLWRVILPLARPSIMAGINQATMMALAMVVVASMIGARGLGEDVLAGIQTLDVGRGLQAGVAIVILAIVIDRITQAYGRKTKRAAKRVSAVTSGAERTEESGLPTENRAPSSETTLEIKEVYKVFGEKPRHAIHLLSQGKTKQEVQQETGLNVGLNNINLKIPAGEITCIMGLSGSGKSTLVRHLNRLIDPSAGEILLNNQNILALSLAELRKLRRGTISMVFQNFGLLPHINVIDNVAFGLRVRGESRPQARRKAQQWLTNVGLQEYALRYPDELSGGMQQRVGLARALATDSEIILMDEAFSALDPLIRYDMQEQLLNLQARLHKTIVFITHDIDEALRLGQHIAILRDGRLEQFATPEEIIEAPANDYIRRFIAHRHR